MHPLREEYRGLLEQLQVRHADLVAGFRSYSLYRRAKEAIEHLLDQLDPPGESLPYGVEPDAQWVRVALLLVGGYEHIDWNTIESWSPQEKRAVWEWAHAVYDEANDNAYIEVPPRPACLPAPLGWGESPLCLCGHPWEEHHDYHRELSYCHGGEDCNCDRFTPRKNK